MTTGSPPSSSGNTTRQYLIALVLLAAGALIGWWAMASTWAVVEVSLLGTQEGSAAQAVARESVSGSSLTALGGAVPIVGLAALAGVIGSRGWFRRAVGVAILVAGIALSWASLVAITGVSIGDERAGGEVVVQVRGGYAVAAIVAGILLGLGGLWTMLRGTRWPSLGANYERATDRPRNAWEALDRGIDPTDGDEHRYMRT